MRQLFVEEGFEAVLFRKPATDRQYHRLDGLGEARLSYSPNLSLIERLRKSIKRRSLYGRRYPAFADFRTVIDLASLMPLKFQRFENVSLRAT